MGTFWSIMPMYFGLAHLFRLSGRKWHRLLQISVTFLSLYLDYFPNKLSKDDAYLLKVLLAASKKAVTKCWLQKNSPTVGLFVNIVKQLHLLERITYSIRLQKELGEKRWGKLSVYLASQTDLV